MIPGLTRYRASGAANILIVSTSNNGSQKSTGVVVNAPVSLVAGNLLLAIGTCDDTSTTLSLACSGWTKLASVNFNSNNDESHLFVFYKMIAGAEPATYTFSGATIKAVNVGIMQISGVSQISPFNGTTPTTQSGTASTTCTFPPIITTAAGALLAVAGQGGNYSTVVSSSLTPGAGYTNAVSSTVNYNKQATYDAESSFALKSSSSSIAAGTNTPPNGTFNTSYKYGAITVPLNPA